MLEKAIEKFKEYTSNYDMSIKEINFKHYHSFTVSELMGELAYRLDLDKEKIEVARVIGLLHDIGRFEQFTKYNALDDSISDHADESVVYLFDNNHIRDFIEESKYDEIIKTAIKYHNKLEIPSDLKEDVLLFTKMIRDMDKVDIYKQLAVHFNYTFEADSVNEEILKCFKEEKLIAKSMVKSETDRLMLFLSFLFDINFEESFDILVSSDNFDLFLSTIDVASNSENLWRKIRELCFDKINRGVNSNE